MASREFVKKAAAALACSLLMATVAESAAGDRGIELFQLCAQCHGESGQGNQSLEAPSIAGLPAWYVEAQLTKFREGLRGLHPADHAALRMRPMAATLNHEGDVAAVSAHIASLPAIRPGPVNTGGDPKKGKTYYLVCSACHGPTGAGDPKQKAPPINRASDWYMLTQLKKFRAGIRGTDPRDTSGLLMRPMSLTLPDEQAMKDVISYIVTLSE